MHSAFEDRDARTTLLADLSSLLTPTVTKFLPETMQLPKGPNAVDTWVSDRGRESDVFCVRDAKTHELLGLLILASFPEPESGLTVRLGYLVSERMWGQGIATELLKGFVRWCEGKGSRIQLLGGVERDNPASASVLIKAGFEKAAALATNATDTFRLDIMDQK